ncbi:MAG: rod shape-determining protein MreD [Treponema sp.]|jgi:rod shape-determining protein MreD|nr:rod shape-determining protein MreD [Treponema sp.]
MAKNVIWAVIFATLAALLESVLFSRIKLYGAVPDLSMGILVFSAYVNGTMTGQLTGFFSGIFYDFLSASPMGLHTFIRTIAGALSGVLKGTFFLDTVVLPMALCGTATLFKALMLLALHLLFAGSVPAYHPLTSTVFWIELLLNTLTAPFLFGFLALFKPLLVSGREQ